MTPQQQSDHYARLNEDFRAGRLTQEQYREQLEATSGSSPIGWVKLVGGMVGSVAAAYATVRVARGPVATPDERVRRKAAVK